jgi:adenylate cyclase
VKKRALLKVLFLIIFWISCTIFIVLYDASILRFKSEFAGGDYSFPRIFMSALGVTLVGALALGLIEVLYLSDLLRRKPFGFAILIKSLVYLMFIVIFVSTAVLYNYAAETGNHFWSKATLLFYQDYLTSMRVIMTIVYWGLACALAVFILQIDEKFGQGILINFLFGKYHRPKEEQRFFMFLDLKSSTTYAEKLGHLKYSQFLQDCFWDLTDIVVDHDAEIYQYVGDEVVLSWKLNKGKANGNCLNAFFKYDSFLQTKNKYYLKQYGVIPEFKAGLNVGAVTVAEVGTIKRELAYHGDVLNTAARIQACCNEYGKKLLVSEHIKILIHPSEKFKYEDLGKIPLKGKAQSVNIYAVTTN